MSARHNAILAAWAAGRTAREIAEALGTTRSAVIGLVFRARAAGDPRAVRIAKDEQCARMAEGIRKLRLTRP